MTAEPHRNLRFTPTCVGKTRAASSADSVVSVHPHVRGENALRSLRVVSTSGSPPRAWGKPRLWSLRRKPFRFTPTCVGKTSRPLLQKAGRSVHPHVRGENEKFEEWARGYAGSPPRAWGKRTRGVRQCRRPRFTPTCVGKTFPTCTIVEVVAVHPHVRGENENFFTRRMIQNGSPPRAWGKPLSATTSVRLKRFTPTCVGKTSEYDDVRE